MGRSARSVVDILNLLPKTNCRECGAPTCMAFAVAALGGARPLSDCPYVEAEAVVALPPRPAAGPDTADLESDGREDAFQEAMARIAKVDLASAYASRARGFGSRRNNASRRSDRSDMRANSLEASS